MRSSTGSFDVISIGGGIVGDRKMNLLLQKKGWACGDAPLLIAHSDIVGGDPEKRRLNIPLDVVSLTLRAAEFEVYLLR